MDNHDLPQPRKARKSKRLKDSPEVRIANLTEYWHVLGQHPTLGNDWRELRECVIDTLVGDLTIPEGSRWERDTPLHLRVPDQAALRTAIPPERRADCARELQRPEGDLAGSTAVMYLQAAAVYITTRYPNLHACRLHLDNDVLRRAFRAVLAADWWEAGLEWLIPTRAGDERPAQADRRAAPGGGGALGDRPGTLARTPPATPRCRVQGAGAAPPATLYPEAPDGDDPQGTVIAIYVSRVPPSAPAWLQRGRSGTATPRRSASASGGPASIWRGAWPTIAPGGPGTRRSPSTSAATIACARPWVGGR